MDNQQLDTQQFNTGQQSSEKTQNSGAAPNKHQILLVILAAIILVAAVGGGIYWWQRDNINKLIFGEQQKACTMEAKLCPDGSSVGRTGPNCEFAACPNEESVACKNLCGDGICQEVVCMAIGCPCAETKESCTQDCAEESGQVIKVSIADILSNPNQYLDKKVQLEEKFCGWGQTTGSAGPLFTRSDWCVCQNPQEKEKQSLTVIGAALPADVSPTEKESIGKILSIIGIVKKTANNISYIEASEIKKIVLGICEINKEYRHTAVEPIECQCPEDYEFKVVEMGWGPCPETGISDCPASTVKCVRK